MCGRFNFKLSSLTFSKGKDFFYSSRIAEFECNDPDGNRQRLLWPTSESSYTEALEDEFFRPLSSSSGGLDHRDNNFSSAGAASDTGLMHMLTWVLMHVRGP